MNRTVDFRYAPEVIQTCIGFADDAHKTIVREDGSLNYHFDKEAHAGQWSEDRNKALATALESNRFFRHRFKPKFHHRDRLTGVNQTYGDPRAAIVDTTETYEHTEFRWTAFAYRSADGLRADVVRWSLQASERFGRARTRVQLASYGDLPGGPAIVGSPAYKTATRSGREETLLAAGERLEGVFAIVLEGSLTEEQLTLRWAERAERQTVDYWCALRPFREPFCIPDAAIMDMLEACGRNILQAREWKDGVCEFQVGPTAYRGLWMVDGHFLLEAAHMMGRQDEAYQGVLAVLRRVKPDGSIGIIPSHLKETAIALATFVRQCELMNDDERLKELWPIMRRALRHLQSLREQARALGPEYPGYSLFPPAFADGGMWVHPEYTTPLWVMYGLQAAHRAGERLGLDGSGEFGALFDEVMEGFRSCTQRDMRRTDSGLDYFPMAMAGASGYKPQTATWALAQAIYPGEVFAPDDPYTLRFLAWMDELDDEQGLPAETGYLTERALWAYAGLFCAQAWLYAGHPGKAADYLYAFANHAAPSRVWIEEQSFADSRSNAYAGDMPHNWASAEFIRLVRNMLVMERRDRLDLLPGLPAQWLPRDKPLVLERTPTQFGKVSLELSHEAADSYRLKLIFLPGARLPDSIVVHADEPVVLPGSAANTELRISLTGCRG